MEELKSYLVEFNKNGAIKDKSYPYMGAMGFEYWWSRILVTCNEYNFSENDDIWKI